ncbi:MAG: hypothetical protein RMA76_01055 [Deltaproteobacteria bacterium]
MSEKLVVYQVMNFDREELFYGTTALELDKEIEKIARNTSGPAREWKKGDVVSWRPLTDKLDPAGAHMLHREFEQGTPPNKFKVIPTYERKP